MRISLITAIMLFVYVSNCQVFTEYTAIEIPNALGYAASQWCDYDNDGDLDLFYSGLDKNYNAITNTLQNNGDNTFTKIDLGFENLGVGSISWSDFNNDGLLDVLLTGQNESGEYQTILYKQNSDTTFVSVFDSVFVGVAASAADWADFNNDGYADLLISGQGAETTYVFELYKNNNGQGFTRIETPNIAKTSLGRDCWVDYNTDGLPDIFVNGYTGNEYISKLYTNLGNNTFEELTAVSFRAISTGYTDWFDYNNDGLPDLFLMGHNVNYYPLLCVYENLGNGAFEEKFANELDGHMLGNLKHCDFNNDGFVDFLITGNADGFISSAKLYAGNGAQFSLVENTGIANLAASFCWGDFNNDTKADIFITGFDDNSENQVALYQNTTENINTKPTAPLNLRTTVSNDTVYFNWDAANDAETNAQSLTYNLFVKTQSDSIIKPVKANLENGYLLVPENGNNAYKTSAFLVGLPDGDYLWTVQSVDAAFGASEFAQPVHFTIGEQTKLNQHVANLNVQIYPNPASEYVIINTNQRNVKLQLLNSIGVVLEKNIPKNQPFNIKKFNPGLYFLKVYRSNDVYATKPIIIF